MKKIIIELINKLYVILDSFESNFNNNKLNIWI